LLYKTGGHFGAVAINNKIISVKRDTIQVLHTSIVEHNFTLTYRQNFTTSLCSPSVNINRSEIVGTKPHSIFKPDVAKVYNYFQVTKTSENDKRKILKLNIIMYSNIISLNQYYDYITIKLSDKIIN
jgi:hypothetical protein